MKRTILGLLLVLFLVAGINAQAKKKKKGPCAASLAACPVTGCGGDIDKNLNRRKNIQNFPAGSVEDMTIAQMQALTDPVPGFVKGGSREAIKDLGEGKKIRVVALALVSRKGSKESCNCGLTGPANTDNHIVLIDPADTTPSLEDDEPNSTTAEFTPRVRLKRPTLGRPTLQPLIDAAPNNALKVRVTGFLMFDSEHSLGRHLKRVNNWEIHPVFAMEYCPTGKTCSDTGTANWKPIGK